MLSVWQRWIVAAIFVIVHTAIVFGLSVPGCPKGKVFSNFVLVVELVFDIITPLRHETLLTYIYIGYLGPGGLYDDSKENGSCTGGATGYIDKWFFTVNHIYSNPTPKATYQTEPFDPEGILGIGFC